MNAITHEYAAARPKHTFGLGSLLRHRRLIGLSGAIFLTLGLLFSVLKTPTYTASTQLLVYIREIQPGPETVILPGRADVSVVQNQVEVIQSRSVLLKVIDALNLKNDPEFASNKPGFFQVLRDLLGASSTTMNEDRLLTNLALESLKRKTAARRVGTSHTVMIAVTASEPTKAARIANEIAQVYLQERAGVLESALSKAPLLRERLKGLGPNAYVISAAEPPIKRDGPRLIVIAFASGFLGLGFGSGLALFLDFMDRRIRTSEQAESVFGLECFGVIPRLTRGTASRYEQQQHSDGFANSSGNLLAWVAQHPTSALAQTLRRIRAALHGSSLRSIGVTSTVAGEGATTISANLAHLMALSGKRVLLVDGAPGNRSLSRQMAPGARRESIPPPKGASSFASHVVTDKRTGLDVFLLSDTAALNPDCVWQALTDEFIHEASASYDLVIVDLPPLASGAEVRAAAHTLDAFLLVVKWGDTDSILTQRAMQSSGAAQEKFVGVVLNMAEEEPIGKHVDKFSLAKFTFAARTGQTSLSGSPEAARLRRNYGPNANS